MKNKQLNYIVFDVNGKVRKSYISNLVATSANQKVFVFNDADITTESTAYRSYARIKRADSFNVGPITLLASEITVENTGYTQDELNKFLESINVDYTSCRILILEKQALAVSGPISITVVYDRVNELGRTIETQAKAEVSAYVYEAVEEIFTEEEYNSFKEEMLPRDLGDITVGGTLDGNETFLGRQGGNTKHIPIGLIKAYLEKYNVINLGAVDVTEDKFADDIINRGVYRYEYDDGPFGYAGLLINAFEDGGSRTQMMIERDYVRYRTKPEGASEYNEWKTFKFDDVLNRLGISELDIANLKNKKIDKASIVNDLTTGGTDKVLSAEQGKLLNESVNELLDNEVVKGVIATDIENKLNAKEQEYTPRLTSLETDVNFNSPYLVNIKERISRPVITFIDDDGHKDVYSRLMPIFRDKGVGFGSAIITDYIDNSPSYMTLAQLKECHDNGLETLSHCVNVATSLTDGYTDEQIDFQLKESQKWLKDNGFEYEGFVYPQNGHNLNIRKRAKEVYKYAFGESGFNDEGYLDHSRIKRIAFGSWTGSNPEVNGNNEKNTLNYYKACVDYAISKNIWLVFMLHIGQQDLSQDVILADLLDYIATTNAVVLKPSEAFKLKSNKLAFGDLEEEFLFVGENGSYTNISGYKIVRGIKNDTPITSFQRNVVSRTDILAADSAGFPTTSGTVETYRGSSDWTSFQIFQAGGTNIFYKRYWNVANNNWDSWEIVNVVKVLPQNAVTMDSPFQSFNLGVISKCWISDTTNTPENKQGILTTDRLTSTNYFIYQTFEVMESQRMYRRYWIHSTNSWSGWLQVGGGSGTTSNRPTTPYKGYMYFDETLNKPIWFNGTNWVDATGTAV